ncbi:MAG: phosphatase PAP2 family protein [Bacteroidales bacterium]|nr:phosphatase PAP2 family protein [Bacteroidales bacterium]
MKKLVTLFLLSIVCFWDVSAQEQTYFSVDELPDLIQCLPAPPAKGSSGFRYDVRRYRWGKAQRNDPERAAMARRDAVWSYEALLTELSVPFGLAISEKETPEIWKLVVTSLATTDQMRVAPKAYYHRTRPFVYFKEKAYLEDDAQFSGEGSYPSGHTMRSWTAALILAEINPAAADAVFARAWQCGESRVISGAHWQSDVDVTRLAASIGYSRLQTSTAFRAQMESAQDEFRRLAEATGQQGREHFVSLTDAVPDAILEIRYFSTYNFVGERIDGYLAPTALMTREAADSLKAVSDDVMRMGYRLKIYDAYRPQCAVDHFVRWAADVSDTTMRRYFYPDVDKSLLFKLDYIMEKSGHTRGSTVDLTLFDMNTEKELDMGGTFDWFGEESHPDYTGITETQFANRMILREAMLRHGFKPLESEWWHFTLRDEPFPDTYFSFPVR